MYRRKNIFFLLFCRSIFIKLDCKLINFNQHPVIKCVKHNDFYFIFRSA